MTSPYIIFELENKKYATAANNVTEIIKVKPFEVFEKMPENILGVIPFRDKIINIIDVKKELGITSSNKESKRIVIINYNNTFAGILVDEVQNITYFNEKEVEQTPYNNDSSLCTGIIKNQNELISILDFQRLFLNNGISHTETSLTTTSSTALKSVNYSLIQDIDSQNSFISFKLDENIYCIDFNHIKEFSEFNLNIITPVPHTPDYLCGIVNLRGEFINIFDIKEFLNIKPKALNKKVKIIIISAQDIKIGILVDDIYDILKIPQEKLVSENTIKSDKNKLTKAEIVLDDQKVISVLDVEKLIRDDRLFIDIA